MEILIVIIILGVIAGISLPRFRDTFNTLRLKATVYELSQFFRYAQGEAVREQCVYKIVIEGESYWLMAKRESGFERVSGRWGRTRNMGDIEVISEEREIFFYPDGRIDRVEIRLKRGEEIYTITTKERHGYVEVLEGSAL